MKLPDRMSRRTVLTGSAATATALASGTLVGRAAAPDQPPAGATTASGEAPPARLSVSAADTAPFDVSALPLLDDKQLGHLQHIRNIGNRLGGDWRGMDADDPLQYGFSSYRYPLAHMAYTLAAAHYHHLPAAPAVIRGDYERIFEKITRLDVWSYWKDTSASGKQFNSDITELRPTWTDPVKHENIMYSGHLLAMMGYHSMLFDSDRFYEPGSLTFTYNPFSGGLTGKPEVYAYDFHKLSEVIYDQFEASNWLGVPCEPNMVFLICNQFPIVGWRYYDHRQGTDLARTVSSRYAKAWTERGWLDDDQFVSMLMVEQDMVQGDSYMTPWMHPYMNTWNGPMMRRLYPRQISGALRELEDGTTRPWAFDSVAEVRAALKAGRSTKDIDDSGAGGDQRFGFVTMWLSEMGDPQLSRVLAYADKNLNPTWEKGGLFYPRNDVVFDDRKRYTYMESFTGNALIGQARLNVDDGYRKMYRHPWGKEHFAQPALSELSGAVGVARASYVPRRKALVLTLRADAEHRPAPVGLTIRNARQGRGWKLYAGRDELASGRVGDGAGTDRAKVTWMETDLRVRLQVRGTVTVTLVWD